MITAVLHTIHPIFLPPTNYLFPAQLQSNLNQTACVLHVPSTLLISCSGLNHSIYPSQERLRSVKTNNTEEVEIKSLISLFFYLKSRQQSHRGDIGKQGWHQEKVPISAHQFGALLHQHHACKATREREL